MKFGEEGFENVGLENMEEDEDVFVDVFVDEEFVTCSDSVRNISMGRSELRM